MTSQPVRTIILSFTFYLSNAIKRIIKIASCRLSGHFYLTPNIDFNGLCIYDFPSPRRVLDKHFVTENQVMTTENCRVICKGKSCRSIISIENFFAFKHSICYS